MWGSDYPHDEGTAPFTREHLRQVMHDLPEDEKRAILGEQRGPALRLRPRRPAPAGRRSTARRSRSSPSPSRSCPTTRTEPCGGVPARPGSDPTRRHRSLTTACIPPVRQDAGRGAAPRHPLGSHQRRRCRSARPRPRCTRRTWARVRAPLRPVGRGDRRSGWVRGAVGQLLHNSPEFVESYFAALKVRAVPFNVNFRYTAEELAYLLGNADAEVLVLPLEPGRGRRRGARHRRPVAAGHRGRRRRAGPRRRRRSRTRRPRRRRRPASPGRPTTSPWSTPVAPPACPRAWCPRSAPALEDLLEGPAAHDRSPAGVGIDESPAFVAGLDAWPWCPCRRRR